MLKRPEIQAEADKAAKGNDAMMWLGWNLVLVLDEIRYHLRDIAQSAKERTK